MNVTIGEKKTYDDWGLKLSRMTISLPEPKTDEVDVPGADGIMDLTEAMGSVKYENRDIELEFDALWEPEKWHAMTSEIANYLHGKQMKVILDTDPGYYYIGRLALVSEKSNYLVSKVTISGNMDPYKYEHLSSVERWKWDSFSFRDGIIRNYGDMEVDGSRQLKIPGRRKEVIPTIIASTAMEVEFKGVRYPVPKGESKIYSIVITEGDNILTFYGHGTVSVVYRGGIL